MDRPIPMPADTVATDNRATDYKAILMELEQQQQQQQPQQSFPEPAPVAAVAPVAPVPPSPALATLVQGLQQAASKNVPPTADSIFVRFRRHIFVVVIAFVMMQYGTPLITNIPFIPKNQLVTSLFMAIGIGIVYFFGDRFFLMPEMNVVPSLS